MKANQTKTTAAGPAKKPAPFFNKEAGHYFQPIQTKLTVNEPGDPMEKEADAMADRVVQKMDKGSISRKPIFESKNEEGVQRQSDGAAGGGGVPASVQQGLAAGKGGGSALPEATRHEMENTMGADLSGVRLHHDGKANQMSKDLGAQAFTHGKDIYFNQGKYSPGSKEGKHLLAHELTHTVQQDAVRRAPAIQRVAGGKGGDGGGGGKGKGKAGDPTFAKDTITFETLYLPHLKSRNTDKIGEPLTRKAGYVREASYVNKAATPGKASLDDSSKKAQASLWKSTIKKSIGDQIKKLLEVAEKGGAYDSKSSAYFLIAKTRDVSLIGTEASITDASLIPVWNAEMKASAYDVDHIKELQLGGTNAFNNMELLNFSANRASGSQINTNITSMVATFLGSPAGQAVVTPGDDNPKPKFKEMPDPDKAMASFDIVFSHVQYNDKKANFSKGTQGEDYWSADQIIAGKHLQGFRAMKPEEVTKAKGSKDDPVIYTAKAGGRGLHVKQFNMAPVLSGAKYDDTENGNQKGTLSLNIKPPNMTAQQVNVPVYRMPGIIYGGSIKRQGEEEAGGLETILKNLEFGGLSPVEVEMADLDPNKGLVMRGVIHPTLEVIKGVDLDFYVEGKEFGISKTLTAGDFKVPSPFRINSALLTIGAGTNGVFADGLVSFEIKDLGQGEIRGKVGSGNFGIEGHFDFDKKLVKSGARVSVSYDNKAGWAIKGKLGLGDNIKGIKSGEIEVGYAGGIFTATGTAVPSIKGMKEVSLRIQVGPDVTEIEGDVSVDKMPGIKSGEGHLKIVKAGDNFSFSGSGKITPDIPKLSTEIDFSFHDDVFTVDATLEYANDRLSGKLHVGITNQDVDDQGNPKKGQGKGQFTVYGGGQLTLKVTDSITAMAGVNLLPDGQIEMKGGISLPGKFQVVPPILDIQDKDIITFPEISIPLFGIPLGVTTIGLEATIDPKLTASVQLGPGSLTNVGAEIDYNPSEPENMSITGSADFEFIASAGITAGVDFAVGISAGIASIKGGVNLSAYINAAAEQPVFHTDIKYSPKTGFELNGDVKAMVKAILGFKGTLFVEGSAGVWPLKIHKRWEHELFKKEIDTGLEIGFEFPFDYKDGKANASWDNLKFKYPTFDENFLHRVKAAVIDPVKKEIFGDDDD